MEDKIEKLEIATKEAEVQVQIDKAALEDSQARVDAAKALLRELSEEEQSKIQVTDTKFPELLAMHTQAKESYESSVKRYETNQRYLNLYKEKLADKSEETAS